MDEYCSFDINLRLLKMNITFTTLINLITFPFLGGQIKILQSINRFKIRVLKVNLKRVFAYVQCSGNSAFHVP